MKSYYDENNKQFSVESLLRQSSTPMEHREAENTEEVVEGETHTGKFCFA